MLSRTCNVAEYLLEGKRCDLLAVSQVGEEHTFGELRDAVSRVSQYVLEKGGEKGDRVILASENSFFWLAAYLGIIRAGLVCVPLAGTISADYLAHVLQNTGAGLIFANAGFAVRNSRFLQGMHLVTDREVQDLTWVASLESLGGLYSKSLDADVILPPAQGDDLAALMFTSGSTGTPRGVKVSHTNIIANTESIIQCLQLTESDRIMAVLPFHYCFGASLVHTHLRVGGALVIESRFMYLENMLQRMIDAKCTGFAGVPSHFQILVRNSSLRRKVFPHLRYFQQAGGHLAPVIISELRRALPKAQVFVMYGQTEATARLSYLPPELLDVKQGSVGVSIPGVKLQVLNASGVAVRPGETGEVVVEGPNVTQGYWRAPKESAKTFRKGKLYTGDLATVDEDGFIYILDRVGDFIKCGGERISCRHLEDELIAFDDLIEAAVVGVKDEVLGEAVKAFVVPRTSDWHGLKERLLLFCKMRMPPRLVPKEIELVNTLPKNSAGKVLKADLKGARG